MTEMGMILGTAGYMAPEQAKGKPVDRRADLWAFGVVLFEMLAGQSLYRGETVTETIAHVITQPPSWDLLPASVPPSVRRLLRRCLEKDPRIRLQWAGDARIEIDEILSGPPAEAQGVPSTATAVAAVPAWRRALPWALAVIAFAALAYQMRPEQIVPVEPVHLGVQLTPEPFLQVSPDNDGAVAVLSPDGRTLVYPAIVAGTQRLYRRPLDRVESTPIAGTEDAVQPFFSPDGRSIAFFTISHLMQVPVSGGVPQTLMPATLTRGGTWGPDGTIVLAPGITTGLVRMPATGGAAKPVTTLASGERSHRWPWFLPDGRHVLFACQMEGGSYDDGTIEVVRIDTGERTVLIRGGTFPRYVNGYLIYARGDTVFAVRFNPDTLELRGEPRDVLHGVHSTGATVGSGSGTGAVQLSIANNGTAVYLPAAGSEGLPYRLAIVDRQGTITYESPEEKRFADPTFSPDDRLIAVRVRDGAAEHLHILDPARGTLTRLTFDGTFNAYPAWSHDGRLLAFASDRDGKGIATYVIPSDGTGEARLVTAGSIRVPGSFSPDDRLLAVTTLEDSQTDLGMVTVADGTLTPFVTSPEFELFPRFSPDGRWVAYTGGGDVNATGARVFVRAYPGGGSLRQVSGGGEDPVWARNGRELLYLSPSKDAVMAVDVTADGEALALGNPRRLFEMRLGNPSVTRVMDATGDGNRIVVLLPSDDQPQGEAQASLTMIFSFTEVLRQAMETAGK
jgi:Tol biopolymer transport system component